MRKRFVVLVRAFSLLLGCSFLLALAVSFLHASTPGEQPLSPTKLEAITSGTWPGHAANRESCYLIDRQSTQCDVMELPSGNRFGQMSISPWRDADGETEAVCQSFRASMLGLDQSFSGLARVRVPQGEVIEEFKLDLLPSGRVCWVPARPGRIVFAAGDGRLYRHDFPGWEAGLAPTGEDDAASAEATKPTLVDWKVTHAGEAPFVTDPFWSRHPLLRRLLIVTVIPQVKSANRPATEATELFWLVMRDDGATVEAAAKLEIPASDATGDRAMMRRFPTVERGQDGVFRLAYLARPLGQRKIRLEVVTIEIDPATALPRVPQGQMPRIVDQDAAPVPPVFSSDGMSIYLVAWNSGLILKRPVADQGPGTVSLADSRR